MDKTPIERVNDYKPTLLIMGVRKDETLESVLCCNNATANEELKKFSYARVFTLREENITTIKNEIK